jgi:hypothetical protein
MAAISTAAISTAAISTRCSPVINGADAPAVGVTVRDESRIVAVVAE